MYAKLVRECVAIFTCRADTTAKSALQCRNTVMVEHGFNLKCLCCHDCHLQTQSCSSSRCLFAARYNSLSSPFCVCWHLPAVFTSSIFRFILSVVPVIYILSV